MSDIMQVILNSKLPRQIVVYTDVQKDPENAYPLPPRGVRIVTLTLDQLSYVRANYSRDVIIGTPMPVSAFNVPINALSAVGVTSNG